MSTPRPRDNFQATAWNWLHANLKDHNWLNFSTFCKAENMEKMAQAIRDHIDQDAGHELGYYLELSDDHRAVRRKPYDFPTDGPITKNRTTSIFK